MTDEQTRRRETANRIRVKASPARMGRAEFDSRYMERNVIISREEIEARCQEMFCDACAEPYGTAGAMLLRTLHVSIEDDPLRNFWKLARLKCFGCGFEEYVPLDRPKFDNPTDEVVMDVWEKEREIFHQNMKIKEEQEIARRRMQQAQANHQLQQIAQLGQRAQIEQDVLYRLIQNAHNRAAGIGSEQGKEAKTATEIQMHEQHIAQSLRERIFGKKS